MNTNDPIPFAAFARFERLTAEKPLLYCEPPAWAAASHAIVVGSTVHYLWAKKGGDNSWVHMHSSAPVANPTAVTHDRRNPILRPSADGFDNQGVEYPFPFWNPADEPNPHNPIFTPATDANAWDRDGLLTPQVFAMNGSFYMIYAGLRGSGWNRVSAVGTGLAVANP